MTIQRDGEEKGGAVRIGKGGREGGKVMKWRGNYCKLKTEKETKVRRMRGMNVWKRRRRRERKEEFNLLLA